MKKKNLRGGFTSLEAVVVCSIAILLAAVAVPVHMSYMRDIRSTVAESVAGTVALVIMLEVHAGRLDSRDPRDAISMAEEFIEEAWYLVVYINKGRPEETHVKVPRDYGVSFDDYPYVVVTYKGSDISVAVPYRISSG